MAKTDFRVAFREFRDLVGRNLLAARNGAVNNLVADLQRSVRQGGNTPEDTGHLLNQLRISRNRVPLHVGRIGHGAALLGVKLGDMITLDRWDVPYAEHVEYGHSTANGTGWVTGRFFTTIAVRNWRRHVAQAALSVRMGAITNAMVGRARR